VVKFLIEEMFGVGLKPIDKIAKRAVVVDAEAKEKTNKTHSRE